MNYNNVHNLIPIKSLFNDFKLYLSIFVDYKKLFYNLYFLKQHQLYRFRILSTISCTDFPELYNRFEITYIIMSLDFPFILHLKTKISEFNTLNSVSSLYHSGVWLERELWDMFGLFFRNNFDLRRLLTDYGFPYHPLRKTFPLQGFNQVSYNFIKKKVYYINNTFNQIKPLKNINSVWNKLI